MVGSSKQGECSCSQMQTRVVGPHASDSEDLSFATRTAVKLGPALVGEGE